MRDQTPKLAKTNHIDSSGINDIGYGSSWSGWYADFRGGSFREETSLWGASFNGDSVER
jgi:hypothetical protein